MFEISLLHDDYSVNFVQQMAAKSKAASRFTVMTSSSSDRSANWFLLDNEI